MPKATFGEHSSKRQREKCLEYAAELRVGNQSSITPTDVTNLCINRGLFSDEQLNFFRFEGARRQVERWLKTKDDTGLEMWAQIPFTDENGELFWDQREQMSITGYAWNYLLRDDCVKRNEVRRAKWRDEGEARFGPVEFTAEVERLRLERKRGAA